MVILRLSYYAYARWSVHIGPLCYAVDIYARCWTGSGITVNDHTYLPCIEGSQL